MTGASCNLHEAVHLSWLGSSMIAYRNTRMDTQCVLVSFDAQNGRSFIAVSIVNKPFNSTVLLSIKIQTTQDIASPP